MNLYETHKDRTLTTVKTNRLFSRLSSCSE